MAGDAIPIERIAACKQALHELPENIRRRVLRNALAAGARVFRDEARRRAPVIDAGNPAVQRGIRKPNTVRDAIGVRTSKIAKAAGDVGVFVNVRPAKGARFKKVRGTAVFGLVTTRTRVQTRRSARGANSPDDPYYWRFLEFGTQKMRAFGFLQAAARSQVQAALARIEQVLGPAIQKFNDKGTP